MNCVVKNWQKGRVLLAPAELGQLDQHLGFFALRRRRVALQATAREAAVQDQVADALGVTHGVGDRDRCALRDAEQRKALEPGGIDHRLEVGDPGVERERGDGPVRQAAAARIVANEGAAGRKTEQDVVPHRAAPVEVEMVEPVGGLDQRRSCAGRRIGEANAVGGRAKTNVLLAFLHRVSPGVRCR